MTTSPADAAVRVDQLIAMTERLTELIAAEARAIEQQKPQELAIIRDESVRLVHAYRERCAQIGGDPQLAMAAPLERRRRLVQATEAFDAVLARQRRAIVAATKVTEGIIRAIAAEVVALRPQGAGYGPTAKPATYGVDATAVALNRKA